METTLFMGGSPNFPADPQHAALSETASSNNTAHPVRLGDSALFDAEDSDATAQFLRSHYTAQSLSLSARYSESSVSLGNADGEADLAAQFTSQQLEFDFFAETRVEEVALFAQRTQRVAAGLNGTEQQSFIEASRSVAARFEFSVSISARALEGFAGAGEKLAEGDATTTNPLADLTNKLLADFDELLNEVLELFAGFFEEDATEFADRIQGIYKQLDGTFDISGLQGLTQNAQAGFQQLEFQFDFSMSISVQQEIVQESDPITFDLDGDGIELTSHLQGARFDILGSGQAVTTAFVTGGDAFLALDRNGNGLIDSGNELFGDQRGAVNGYEELRKLDGNRDGVIDRNDASFDELLLFRDDGDGKTEENELLTLADAGIASIDVNYQNVNQRASGGNRIAQISSFTRSDGSRGSTADAILNYRI